MLSIIINSALRHVISTLGGALAASGVATSDQTQAIVGGLTAIIAVGLSWYDKRIKK